MKNYYNHNIRIKYPPNLKEFAILGDPDFSELPILERLPKTAEIIEITGIRDIKETSAELKNLKKLTLSKVNEHLLRKINAPNLETLYLVDEYCNIEKINMADKIRGNYV